MTTGFIMQTLIYVIRMETSPEAWSEEKRLSRRLTELRDTKNSISMTTFEKLDLGDARLVGDQVN